MTSTPTERQKGLTGTKNWPAPKSGAAALLAAATLLPLAAAPAAAQEADPLRGLTKDPFARDRNESVRQRFDKTNAAQGIRLGGFRLFPELRVVLEHNDNILSRQTNTESDTIWRPLLLAGLYSGWSRHALNFNADYEANAYFDNDSEDANQWGVATDGRLDTGRGSNLTGRIGYRSSFEPRGEFVGPTVPDAPVEFDETRVDAGVVQAFNRLRVAGQIKHTTLDFKNGRDAAGAFVLQDGRDRDLLQVDGRAEYAVSPALSVFGSAGWRTTDYDLGAAQVGFDQDSSGWRTLAGASFDISATLRGEVSIGAIAVEFDRPGASDLTGLTTFNRLDWFPTPLLTVTGQFSRDVVESELINSPGQERTNAAISADYEFRRNIVVGGQVAYTWGDYNGIDREDRRIALSADVTYQLNRTVGIRGRIQHDDSRSGGAQQDRDFDQNVMSLALVLRR